MTYFKKNVYPIYKSIDSAAFRRIMDYDICFGFSLSA